MAKRLVKYFKNPWRNFLIFVCLFCLYLINHKYLGLDFSSEFLDSFFNFFPLFLLLFLIINILHSNKNKLLFFVQIFVLIFFGLFYFLGAFIWTNERRQEKIDLGEGSSVELVIPNDGRDNYLVQEDQLLYFFMRKKCIFSLDPEFNSDWKKEEKGTIKLSFVFKEKLETREIQLTEPGIFTQVYQCEQGSEENVDPFGGIFTFWLNLLSIPFSKDEYNPLES